MRKLVNFGYYVVLPFGVTYYQYGPEHTFLPITFGLLLCSLMNKLDEIKDNTQK